MLITVIKEREEHIIVLEGGHFSQDLQKTDTKRQITYRSSKSPSIFAAFSVSFQSGEGKRQLWVLLDLRIRTDSQSSIGILSSVIACLVGRAVRTAFPRYIK